MSDSKPNATPVPMATKADTSTIQLAADGSGEPVRIGEYAILGELGRGGMGVVYRAEDPHLKREVALKVMLPQFAADPDAKARFVREARAQAKVEHEHVAAIFQVAEHAGVPYLVMPLLKGMTLHAALKANPRPPLGEVIRIARETAEGLAAAHEKGLIHRDIKPANIWLEGKKLRVRVLDFGLARGANSTPDSGPVTQQGMIVGTPAYMSPEQGRGKTLDGRTDLWSVGVMLYLMTTGELPFNGDTTLAVLTALAIDNPPPPIEKNPNMPPALSALVMRLLSKDPAFRPPTAEDLAEELRAIEASLVNAVRVIPLDAPPPLIVPMGPDPFADLDATEVTTLPPETDESGRIGGSDQASRHRFPVWGIVAAVLLTAGATVAIVIQQLGEKPVDVVKPDPQPPPRNKDPQGTPPIPEADRKAADLFHPYGPIKVRLENGDVVDIQPSDSLPTKPFALTTVQISREMPADRVAEAIPALLSLSRFQVFIDDQRRVPWSEADFEKLARSQSRETFIHFHGALEPTPKNWETANRFPKLVSLYVWAGKSDDATLAQLPPLPRVTGPGATDLGKSGLLTTKGWASLFANRGITNVVLYSPVNFGAAEAKVLAQLPELQGVTINSTPTLDESTVRELSRAQQLTRFGVNDTKLGPGVLTRITEMTRLNELHLSGCGLNDAEIKKLSSALPRCTIIVEGKVLSPSDPHWAAAKHFLSRPGCSIAVKKANGGIAAISRAEDVPNEPFTLINVTCAKMNQSEITDDDMKYLEAIPTLTNFNVTSFTFSVKGLRSLAASSKGTLTHLYLGHCALTDDDMSVVLEFTALENIDIRGTKITDVGFKQLGSLPRLQLISLPDSAITDAALKHLVSLPRLRSLNLRNTSISNAGIDSLANMKELVFIGLKTTRVTEEGFLKLKAALPKCNIDWDQPSRATAAALLKGGRMKLGIRLAKGQTLAVETVAQVPDEPFTVYEVFSTRPLTDADMQNIARFQGVNDVRGPCGPGLTEKGVEALLELKSTLTFLSLHSGKLSDESLKTIGQLTRLQQLWLFSNPLTDAGFEHLRGLTALESLYVQNTNLTDAGLKHFLGMKKLKVLSVSNTAISDACIPTLSEMKWLTSLFISTTRITDGGMKKLQDALPNCQFTWEKNPKPKKP